MGRLGAVEAANDLGGKILRIHILGEKLSAEECPPCFPIGHRFATGDGGEAGFPVLIAVPARFAAHNAQGFFAVLGVERHGEIVILFKIAVGVAVGTDVDGGHRFSPQTADATPGDGHGIVVRHGAGGDKGPLAGKFVICIEQKLTHVHSSFLHSG